MALVLGAQEEEGGDNGGQKSNCDSISCQSEPEGSLDRAGERKESERGGREFANLFIRGIIGRSVGCVRHLISCRVRWVCISVGKEEFETPCKGQDRRKNEEQKRSIKARPDASPFPRQTKAEQSETKRNKIKGTRNRRSLGVRLTVSSQFRPRPRPGPSPRRWQQPRARQTPGR